MVGLLILAIIVGGAIWAIFNPVIGMMFWTWIGVMNPHREFWGIGDYPVATICGAGVLIGTLLYTQRQNIFYAPAVMLMLFMAWVLVGFQFSFYPEAAAIQLDKVLKVDLMILVALLLLYSKQHILMFVWVLVFSLGYWSVKGGIFTLTTGGGQIVFGPEGSFISSNNALAVALVMIFPLIHFLRSYVQQGWIKHGLSVLMLLTAVATLGTQSRGALVAIAAMLAFLWWRGQNKLLLGMLMLIGAVLLFMFMPAEWHERMGTISEYETDRSAQGRINAWMTAFNLAKENLFGGGFSLWSAETFARYAPIPEYVHDAHSIYFEVLGEQGFGGLVIWFAIWVFTWRSANWVRKHARGRSDTEWAAQLANLCQVSLIGYAVGGAFQGLAYFDLPLMIMVIVVATQRWLQTHLATHAQDSADGDRKVDRPRYLSPYLKPRPEAESH